MPLDPAMLRYLEVTAALDQAPPWETGHLAAREATEKRAPELAGPAEEVASVEDRTLDTPEGSVRVRIYHPAGAGPGPYPALLWYHGGGWVTGSLETHDAACRAVCNRAGCAVIAVDYRMAPEHPFPAAVADSWIALQWAAEHGTEVGVDKSRLAVGGDSAGGNLAAVMSLRAAERGHPRLSAQVLIYPVTDSDLHSASYESNGAGHGLTRDTMRWFFEQYAPDPRSHLDPDLAPMKALTLQGVAPALVVTCEFDPLLSEGEAYARRLEEAGIETTYREEAGMIHGYFRWAGITDRAEKTYGDIASHLRRHCGEA